MKKSYVFNTLICCGCTALIFLLHFVVYGGVLLKSPGYTGLFCAVWIAHAAGYSGTLEPEERPHTAVRVRVLQLLYCILFGSVLFATIEDPYNVLCWFCVVYGVVYIIFFLRKGDNGGTVDCDVHDALDAAHTRRVSTDRASDHGVAGTQSGRAGRLH